MFVHWVLTKLKPGVARNDPRVQVWEPGSWRCRHQEAVALEREIADWIICDYEVA